MVVVVPVIVCLGVIVVVIAAIVGMGVIVGLVVLALVLALGSPFAGVGGGGSDSVCISCSSATVCAHASPSCSAATGGSTCGSGCGSGCALLVLASGCHSGRCRWQCCWCSY